MSPVDDREIGVRPARVAPICPTNVGDVNEAKKDWQNSAPGFYGIRVTDVKGLKSAELSVLFIALLGRDVTNLGIEKTRLTGGR